VPAPLLQVALGEMSTIPLASTRVVPAAASGLGFRFRYTEIEAALTDLCRAPGIDLEFEQW
jgi:NAD dependent epimerase/dehydratase family enzyme